MAVKNVLVIIVYSPVFLPMVLFPMLCYSPVSGQFRILPARPQAREAVATGGACPSARITTAVSRAGPPLPQPGQEGGSGTLLALLVHLALQDRLGLKVGAAPAGVVPALFYSLRREITSTKNFPPKLCN